MVNVGKYTSPIEYLEVSSWGSKMGRTFPAFTNHPNLWDEIPPLALYQVGVMVPVIGGPKFYLLLMKDIMHHLGYLKPSNSWDIYHINWCRISSINDSITIGTWFPHVFVSLFFTHSFWGEMGPTWLAHDFCCNSVAARFDSPSAAVYSTRWSQEPVISGVMGPL